VIYDHIPGHTTNPYSEVTENFFELGALVLALTNTIDKAWPLSYTVLTREGESRYEFLGPKYVAYSHLSSVTKRNSEGGLVTDTTEIANVF
jgi:hypothetical protein